MSDKVYILKFRHIKWLLIISYIVAFIFDSMLNIGLSNLFIPSMTVLMLLFWITQLLSENHFFTATVLGVITDTMMNTLLGSHALIFIIITFLLLRIRHSFKNYPRWQQTVIVIFYLYIIQILSYITLQPNFIENQMLYYWTSPFLAIIFWPILHRIMHFFTDRSVT